MKIYEDVWTPKKRLSDEDPAKDEWAVDFTVHVTAKNQDEAIKKARAAINRHMEGSVHAEPM